MAQVFLSYATEDRGTAAMLARALEAHDLSVWWDRHIPPGRNFDDVIEHEIETADCVVVLWSPAAVGSRWVRAEAADAEARNVLVPAMIASCKIPLQFRHIQAANLTSWRGAHQNHVQFEALLAAISGHLRGAPHRAPPPPPPPRPSSHEVRSESAWEPVPGPSAPARAREGGPPPTLPPEEPPASTVRSIVAVSAALALVIVVSLVTPLIFPSSPSDGPLFALDYGRIIRDAGFAATLQTIACWLAAFLAPRRAMRHALIVGIVLQASLLALAGEGTLAIQNLWFYLSIPSAIAGGFLREWQLARKKRSGTV